MLTRLSVAPANSCVCSIYNQDFKEMNTQSKTHFTVAVYGSRRQNEFAPRVASFIRRLNELGMQVIIHSKLYRYLASEVPGRLDFLRVVDDEDDDWNANVAVSFGGDGTFLRTAHWIGHREIPIAGVNTGHLGYLTAFTIDDIDLLSEVILSGNIAVEERSVLAAYNVTGREPILLGNALNEVAVLKTDDASMISCQMTIGEASPALYKADGVLVSTPTGSTGYNLSVDGPILQPTASVLVISPIAAHSLTMRPLVVGDDNEIVIKTECRSRNFLVSIDGRSLRLDAGSCIRIAKAPFITKVVQRPDHTFVDTLRTKLLWGI